MSDLKITDASSNRRESEKWRETYATETEIQRRRREMPAKLRRLGLGLQHSDKSVLDVCCGHGEALDALYEMGFRRLSGIDITVTEKLRRDPRFVIHEGDVLNTDLPTETYDWITCIHSMHHFATAANVRRFVDESWHLLKPGGRLSILDFSGSLRIRLAFWFFREPRLHITPYLRYFGQIIQEEWIFLNDYLPQWPEVRQCLWNGRFLVERESKSLFYFYLTLRKPPEKLQQNLSA